MKSIYHKLISGFLLTIIISFTFASYISLRNNSEEIYDTTIKDLKAANDYVIEVLQISNILDNDGILIDFMKTSKIDISIVYNNTTILEFGNSPFDTIKKNREYFNELDSHLGIEARKNDIVGYGQQYLIDGQKISVITSKDTSAQRNSFIGFATLIFSCVFLTGNIIFLLVAEIIVKPITKLTNATKELSHGNFSVRVNYAGNDEISRLNQGFNQMAVQLAKQEETRQKFISDISHEFQTPLTAIQGFANIFKEEELPREQRKKFADIILFNSKRLSNLSKNMLQLTMLENDDLKMEYQEYSIVQQIERVIEMNENSALIKNIEIVFDKQKKDVMIWGDQDKLEQVWINLLSNSIKYTNCGGLVTISIKKNQKTTDVSFEDTGIGMASDVTSNIFNRFYREDKARSIEGNGLGLSIVKSIVNLHDGSINVISEVDVGSVFKVSIPNTKINIFKDLLNK